MTKAALRFRDDVVLLMHEQGLGAARRATEGRRTGPTVGGNIHGLAATLRAHNAASLDLSESLDLVCKEAEIDGHPFFWSIQCRRGRETADAYAVTSLGVLLKLLPLLEQGAASQATSPPPHDMA